jgi:hypothetical protein
MLNLPVDNLSLLSNDAEMAGWRRQDLLPDDSCFENACLVKRSRSWPLIIDPYGDARTWIGSHHKSLKEDISFIHATEENHIISLVQMCAEYGKVVFIDGVDSDLVHDLGDLYEENFIGKPAPADVVIAGKKVPFNSHFQIYFSTRQKIPKYSDDFVARIAVVNFGSSAAVLELQMLGALLDLADQEHAVQSKELYQKEVDMQVRIEYNQTRLVDALCEIEGNVVDSVNALNEIKGLRNEMGAIKKTKEVQRKEREQLQKEIDQYVEVRPI